MAKTALNINDFSGGINLYSDSKDISENEFTESRSLSNNINKADLITIKTGGDHDHGGTIKFISEQLDQEDIIM